MTEKNDASLGRKQAVGISYGLFAGAIALTGYLHLGMLLITFLFSLFLLSLLRFKSKLLAVVAYVAILVAILYAFGHFARQAVTGFPSIAETSIPSILVFAEQNGINLPFDDMVSLKALLVEKARKELSFVGSAAKRTTLEFALFIIGSVVAASVFLKPGFTLEDERSAPPVNAYQLLASELEARCKAFFESFRTVMSAQLTIATINTGATAAFVATMHLPYSVVIIGVTFLCGLLPIIGNILSNTVIVAIGFTVSPKLAAISLAYLVILHKMEYFLNSKIIGEKIKNPIWMTLVALVLGERLMGLTGMILAPVVLNFMRLETSRYKISETDRDQPADP